jgi:hypothetical protein
MTPVPLASHRRQPAIVRLAPACAACAVFLLVNPAPAAAQMVMNSVEHLAFDRPESWALKYFAAATLLGGLETPNPQPPGSVSIGLEAGWLPSLTDAQQLVGYYGTESQDLNKAPFFPRPRVSIGLPASFSLIVAVVPPVPMFGLKTKLLAVGLGRPVLRPGAWSIGARVYGQFGTVSGSYTCPASTLAFEPGSAGNHDGCEAASSDTASLRYAGGELSAAYRSGDAFRLSPHAAFGVAYMDVGFQVNALTFGMVDHTHYLSHGTVISASGGVTYRLSNRFVLSTDVFYSPLAVSRSIGAPVRNDGLFTLRTLLSYRMR